MTPEQVVEKIGTPTHVYYASGDVGVLTPDYDPTNIFETQWHLHERSFIWADRDLQVQFDPDRLRHAGRIDADRREMIDSHKESD